MSAAAPLRGAGGAYGELVGLLERPQGYLEQALEVKLASSLHIAKQTSRVQAAVTAALSVLFWDLLLLERTAAPPGRGNRLGGQALFTAPPRWLRRFPQQQALGHSGAVVARQSALAGARGPWATALPARRARSVARAHRGGHELARRLWWVPLLTGPCLARGCAAHEALPPSAAC